MIQAEPLPTALQLSYGHTDTHVIVRFNRMTDHVLLTPEEARALVELVEAAMEKLAAYRKGH